jgi:hypothetical protein
MAKQYYMVGALPRLAKEAIAGCHSEPFDFAQDKLRKESVLWKHELCREFEILRRFAPRNDGSLRLSTENNLPAGKENMLFIRTRTTCRG